MFVEDVRRNGCFLRVTWHGDERTFVVSNWEDDVCVGASRVDVHGAAKLVGLLANGIADAATPRPASPPASPTTLRDLLRVWWRGKSWRAPVLPLRPHQRSTEESAESA